MHVVKGQWQLVNFKIDGAKRKMEVEWSVMKQ